MSTLVRFTKRESINILLFLILVVAISILQSILLKEQLQYGFRDGDWMILFRYKDLGDLSLNHLINAWKLHGVYTYQIYYIGFAEALWGLDFETLHRTSHFFKLLASLSIFPLVLLITRSKLTAFLSALIYSISYSTVGALFMFLTGAYFIAIIFMNLFIIAYVLVLKYRWDNLPANILLLILFISTLALNTERMYPLIPIVILIEFFWLLSQKFKPAQIKASARRTAILFTPFFIFFVYYFFQYIASTGFFFTPFQVFPGTAVRVKSILEGNWQLILSPFASFGSLFIPDSYWEYFGKVNTTSLTSFLKYFLGGPVFLFTLITTTFAIVVFENPRRIILRIIIPFISFGLLAYLLFKNSQVIEVSKRIHFDPNPIFPPAFIGFYILLLAFTVFLEWKKNPDKLLVPIFLSSLFSFVFILFTWLPSDIMLTFVGPQRYLVVPAIGSSLFQAGVISILTVRMMGKPFLRRFVWIPILLVVPIILMNWEGSHKFFDYELNFAGMRGTEQTVMKNKFWALAPNISSKEPSFFYFDESQAGSEGYFGESTILAGFDFWIKFKGDNVIKGMPDPGFMRSNVSCPKPTPQSCLELLKQYLTAKRDGLLVKDKFYKLENFYAIQFIGRNMVDIKKEVLSDLLKE